MIFPLGPFHLYNNGQLTSYACVTKQTGQARSTAAWPTSAMCMDMSSCQWLQQVWDATRMPTCQPLLHGPAHPTASLCGMWVTYGDSGQPSSSWKRIICIPHKQIWHAISPRQRWCWTAGGPSGKARRSVKELNKAYDGESYNTAPVRMGPEIPQLSSDTEVIVMRFQHTLKNSQSYMNRFISGKLCILLGVIEQDKKRVQEGL